MSLIPVYHNCVIIFYALITNQFINATYICTKPLPLLLIQGKTCPFLVRLQNGIHLYCLLLHTVHTCFLDTLKQCLKLPSLLFGIHLQLTNVIIRLLGQSIYFNFCFCHKIDLKNADPDRVEKQIEKMFDIPKEECIRVSTNSNSLFWFVLLVAMFESWFSCLICRSLRN